VWLPFYAADIYITRGMALSQAVVAAVTPSTCYLIGRLFGPPAIGFISDRVVSRGISRSSLAVGFLILSAVLFQMLPLGVGSIAILCVISFLMGMSINMYPLVTTAVSEAFGPQRTSSVMGFLNTFAQLSGATALFISGYLGIALNSAPGNTLEDYRGIWLVGIVGCVGAAAIGTTIFVAWKARSRGEARKAVV